MNLLQIIARQPVNMIRNTTEIIGLWGCSSGCATQTPCHGQLNSINVGRNFDERLREFGLYCTDEVLNQIIDPLNFLLFRACSIYHFSKKAFSNSSEWVWGVWQYRLWSFQEKNTKLEAGCWKFEKWKFSKQGNL